MCLISVIIPVYNCEQYINQCLDSIYNAVDTSLFEVICVNDGSEDSSLQILTDYRNNHDNFKLLSQPNSGAGVARNTALEEASGDYIWFIDGDDFLVPNSFKYICEIVQEIQFDVLIFNYNHYYSDETLKPIKLYNFQLNCYAKIPSGNLNYYQIDKEKDINKIINSAVMPWNKIYSCEFIKSNKLSFDPIFNANDRSFFFKSIYCSKKIIVIDDILINYRKNTGVTKTILASRFDNSLYSFVSTKALVSDNPLYFEQVFKATLRDCIWLFHNVIPSDRWNLLKKMISAFNGEMDVAISGIYNSTCIEYSFFSLIKSRTYLLSKTEHECIPIVFATDANYAPYLAVSIQSIIENSAESKLYDIYILHSSRLGMSNISKIREMAKKNIKITFVNIQAYLNNVKLYSRAHYSVEMFNRLLIPDVILFYSKVLYLDCDMIILSDLIELYDTDINEYILAAVHSDSNEEMNRYIRNVLKLDDKQYFNSGMILINNDNFFAESIKEKCFSLINQSQIFVCPDQDVLNMSCYTKVFIFQDDTWNFQWHTDLKDGYSPGYKKQKIIHYTSGKKAWNCPAFYLSKYFWQYAKQTTFYEEIIFRNVLSTINLNNSDSLKELVHKNPPKKSFWKKVNGSLFRKRK